MTNNGFLDNTIKRFTSRKLLVFIIATIGLFSNYVPSSDWVFLAIVYIAAQGTVDVIDMYKSKMEGDSGSSGGWKGIKGGGNRWDN